MGQPYVGEIRMFAGNFPPVGWMFCEGQLLPISENETLFVLIGTTYGGDGESTFALPDLRGRLPLHVGQGPGGSNYILAESGGQETVTLGVAQIPAHAHGLMASSSPGGVDEAPAGRVLARASTGRAYALGSPAVMAPSLQSAGGSQPHENMQPYLCLSFIISLFGIFPTPT
jgi:microcystin-dependent protein